MSAPEILHENGVTIVELGKSYQRLGEDRISEVSKVLMEASQAEPPLVLIDLSQTEFFSSSFIEVLFRVWNRIQPREGGRFALCGLTPYCAEVLQVTNLDKLWEIYETRDAALQALPSHAA
ncbi:MAG: anti-sigma factor antagonist [Planctomycetota bacterium]|nr:MAG: anti-sigma factor antagonist [Planctomycetota bacterium]REJ96614.1 MAG: anti-sigma factor antagonist [Planctomycetota bacterium]REK24726.1 MAG: anti-sigma factor antagonist [Planctomycetota bacterium]REK29997.1 MAG: anti-sigma factor antagonist [Planctomycetota bacterium]